jgi:hypothetical protein
MIIMQRREPEKSMNRFYALDVHPDLIDGGRFFGNGDASAHQAELSSNLSRMRRRPPRQAPRSKTPSGGGIPRTGSSNKLNGGNQKQVVKMFPQYGHCVSSRLCGSSGRGTEALQNGQWVTQAKA